MPERLDWNGETLKQLVVEVAVMNQRLETVATSLEAFMEKWEKENAKNNGRLSNIEQKLAKHDVWIGLFSFVVLTLLGIVLKMKFGV